MAIIIKTLEEIDKVKKACRLAVKTLEMIEFYVKEGVTTNYLNDICHKYITEDLNALPSPLNYRGYPKSICTSINHQVCHGIPSERKLKNGDILNIDITISKDGYHGDTSKMFFIGEPSIKAKRLVDICQECLYIGIKEVKPGAKFGNIGAEIQKYAESKKLSVVREYCGHGIGAAFHEEPQVLHFGEYGTGAELRPGMIFTIEPMINFGKRFVKLLPDKWTVITKDRSLSAQWEHTILVTDFGSEILTKRDEENFVF